MPTKTHGRLLWNWITNIQTRVQWSTSKILFKGFLCLSYNIYALSPCNNSLSSIRSGLQWRGGDSSMCPVSTLSPSEKQPAMPALPKPDIFPVTHLSAGKWIWMQHVPHSSALTGYLCLVPLGWGPRHCRRESIFLLEMKKYCVCSAVKWLVSAVSFGWVLNGIKLPSSHKYF